MATGMKLPMAVSLQKPMAMAVPSSSSRLPRGINFRTCCSMNATSKAKIPLPPINPKDPFLSKLASVASTSPETLLSRPGNSDSLPYLDIFDSPQLMAAPAQVERSVSYNEHRSRRPPPDLPSLLLHGRIVYIGMPLVPAVTELVIAQLMYLQWMDPKEPIYIYINSSGTTRDDGETIHTLTVGAAIGQACLLLAAGTKGKRFMMPHSKAMIQQPRVPSSGLMPASDVLIRAKEVQILLLLDNLFEVELRNFPLQGYKLSFLFHLVFQVITNRDTLVELLAKHTGNSLETVANAMKRPFYMDAIKAKEFGVIDKILWRGQEKIMAEVASPEDWDKGAGIKAVDEL
ncbi:ATP-dependent Clp protease proteolytic subunit-related protein 3, chloroplastic [Cucurbita argyrosperma subsp. argyrosperma]|nr:ATP-dependent Clp protease proteolytic subunit-related protein 3, chloroplastic [Cucurbita argyrosperma subsp. argyrosperma]